MKNFIFDDGISSIFIEKLYCVGGYITYSVQVQTCGFSGISNFCISENRIRDISNSILKMQKTLTGTVSIEDNESDAILKLYFEDDMNMYMVGQLGGSYQDNVLKFKLKADQTLLSGFLNIFLA